MRKITSIFSCLLIVFLLIFWPNITAMAAGCSDMDSSTGCLFGWNDPGDTGQTWTGWSWSTNTDSYGDIGWIKNGAVDFGGGDWRPRSFIKGDSGTGSTAMLDNTTHAPSTSSGSCLEISNPGTQSCSSAWGKCSASWWVNLPNNTMYSLGLTNNNTNRLDYYVKYHGAASGLPSNMQDTVEIGTYLFPDNNITSGNEIWHYYHQMDVANDVWMHVLLDRHPQHARDATGVLNPPVDNPVCADGTTTCGNKASSYYHNFSSIYFDLLGSSGATTVWLDEMKFLQTTQPENDISISTVWIAYRSSDDHWLLFWDDSSFNSVYSTNGSHDSTYNDDAGSTFEIRWSTGPITNANFSSATLITPLYNAGIGCSSCVSRQNPEYPWAYTEFQLQAGTETNNNHLYFAIKDISVAGQHGGVYPLTYGDGHNAPSSNIHTIDYNIRPDSGGSDTVPPAAPSGLSVY